MPATLGWLREPHEAWPMRDRLPERVERRGFLDINTWLQWCDVRTKLAREYPNAADLHHAAVLGSNKAAGAIVDAWAYGKARLPSLPDASH